MEFKWNVIDIDNLPRNKVLCANFIRNNEDLGEKMYGEVKIVNINGEIAIYCGLDECWLRVSHYCDISIFDIYPDETRRCSKCNNKYTEEQISIYGGCNEEGEDFYEWEFSCEACKNEEEGSAWGEFEGMEEFINSL